MFIQLELKGGKRMNVDGTRTIRAYISHNGKAYYTSKYAVKPSQWDGRRAKIKEDVPNSQLWNNELVRLRNDIEGLCLKHPNLSASDIVKMIGKNSIETLKSFWEQFLVDCANGKQKRSASTAKKYKEALGSIEKFDLKYERRSDFDTMNMKWYEDYTGYLRSERKLNETSVGDHIKLIKAIMRMAYDVGISANIVFQKRDFKVTHQPSDSIYLTEEEIKLIEDVDLTNFSHLQNERDRFLLSYYFLLRFGDSLLVNETNIFKQNGKTFIKIISEKTNVESILPVNSKALVLLKKYNYSLPKISNQKANDKLKEIGEEAEIKTMTTLLGVTRKKYHFISSHTARRSAATHLYLQGLPLKELSHLLGHKKISQTEEYIRVSKLESAKKAFDLPFFK